MASLFGKLTVGYITKRIGIGVVKVAATGAALVAAEKALTSITSSSSSESSDTQPDISGWTGDLSDIDLLESTGSGFSAFETTAPTAAVCNIAYRRTRFGRSRVLIGSLALGVSASIAGVLIYIFEIIGPAAGTQVVPKPPVDPIPDKEKYFALCKEHSIIFQLSSRVGCPSCHDEGRAYKATRLDISREANPDLFRGDEFIPQGISLSYLSFEEKDHKWVINNGELHCSCGSLDHVRKFSSIPPVFSYEPCNLRYYITPTALREVISSYGYVIGHWSDPNV